MEYKHTRISEIVSCLRSCWSDIYEMCQGWDTTEEYLTESGRIASDAFYRDSEINRNAQRLYILTADHVLQSEVDMGKYPTAMVMTNLSEVDRINDRINNYFERAHDNKYEPINEFLSNDIDSIRTAISKVQYVLWPIIDPPKVDKVKNENISDSDDGDDNKSFRQDATNDLQYNKFEDLILSKNFNECLDALRRYRTNNEKAVLGEGLNWIGGRKLRGVLVAWIERMESVAPPKIRQLDNRKHLVVLLNSYFEGLNMGKDASVFDKTAKAEYCDAFKALIPS